MGTRDSSLLSRYGFLVLAVVVIAGGIGLVLASSAGWLNKTNQPSRVAILDPQHPENTSQHIKPRPIPEGYVEVGGVLRPRSDVEAPSQRPSMSQDHVALDPGRTPPVKKAANAHTLSVATAFRTPELSHRLTSMLPAPPFDLAAYKADREKYLTTVEPGRVWQNLPVGGDATPIKRTSRYFCEVLQGESVILKASASPGMPVTFYSPRLGQFQNGLTTISVAADDDGIASARFKVTPGTQGAIDILATSPVHSDQARYLIRVRTPEQEVAAR